MKKKKSLIFVLVVIVILIAAAIAPGEEKDNKDTTINNEKGEYLKENFTTYEEVNEAYNKNLEKIMNNEQLRELDMMNIKLEDILEYAEKSKEMVDKVDKYSDKITVVEKLVSLDDLEHNTTQDAMTETIKYVIEEYESGNYINNSIQFLYLTRYLDKRLDNHPNMKNVDDMIFDMYQIIKDTIRVNDPNIQENLKSELSNSLEENKEQINKNIISVKESL